MKKSKQEIMNELKEVVGERTDDTVLALLEDIDDTLSDEQIEDWESKYKELDEQWKKKYKERFFSEPKEAEEPEEPEEPEAENFDDLFEEGK